MVAVVAVVVDGGGVGEGRRGIGRANVTVVFSCLLS